MSLYYLHRPGRIVRTSDGAHVGDVRRAADGWSWYAVAGRRATVLTDSPWSAAALLLRGEPGRRPGADVAEEDIDGDILRPLRSA